MTEKQIRQKFKETYPDFMLGDEPLSPYFDIWEYAIEMATKEIKAIYKKQRNKRIDELQKKNAELKEKNKCYEQLIDEGSVTLMQERLKNYKQLTKAKEIIKELLGCLYSVEYDRVSNLDKAEEFLKE